METALDFELTPNPKAPKPSAPPPLRLAAAAPTHLDSTKDPGWGFVYRVGDATGHSVLMDIVDESGRIELRWFNFHRSQAVTGTTDEWRILNMVGAFATTHEAYQKLGKQLSAAEWRALWPSPVASLLARYEARTLDIEDDLIVDIYLGLVYQLGLARLAENEQKVDELLRDQEQVDVRERYREDLREASVARDRLEERLAQVRRTLSRSQHSFTFGLPKPGLAPIPSLPQRLTVTREEWNLAEALKLWMDSFPLLSRISTSEISEAKIRAVLEKIKGDIQKTRDDLVGDGRHKSALGAWDLSNVRPAVDATLGARARAVIEAETKSRARWGWISAGASIALGIGLLFLPGGAFLDAVIGAAMVAKSWDEASTLGRASNTGLRADAGLVALGDADAAQLSALIGTVLFVMGSAAMGLRLLRKWRAATEPFAAEHFPTPAIAKTTGDAAKNQKIEEFAVWMAEQANSGRIRISAVDLARMPPTKRAQTLEELYQSFVEARYQKAVQMGSKGPEKIKTPIKAGDPNYDPFGKIQSLEGSPAYNTREEMGALARERFSGTSGDTVRTKVQLPNGETIEGNAIHRGATADRIDVSKGSKYGYAKGEEKLITETTSPANQRKLHDAGIQIMGEMAARSQQINASPALVAKAREEFATALYAMIHGPINNRGSDSVIRLFGSVMHQRIFGKRVILPHDVDIRAYVLDQKAFTRWLLQQI